MESSYVLFAIVYISTIFGLCFAFWTWYFFRSINIFIDFFRQQYSSVINKHNDVVCQLNSLTDRTKSIESSLVTLNSYIASLGSQSVTNTGQQSITINP